MPQIHTTTPSKVRPQEGILSNDQEQPRMSRCQLLKDTTKDLVACCLNVTPSDGLTDTKFRTQHDYIGCIHECSEQYIQKHIYIKRRKKTQTAKIIRMKVFYDQILVDTHK